jgi:hypothetical protein
MDCDPSQHGFDGRRRLGALLTLWLGLCAATLFPSVVRGQDAAAREYKVKAAFVFNFLKFVEGGSLQALQGKREETDDPNQAIVVGVVGRLPAPDAFEKLETEHFGDWPIRVRGFPGFTDLRDEDDEIPARHPRMEEIRDCHILFIGPSERAFLPRLLAPLCEAGILTVGDVPGFLEAGGIMNFVFDDKKVRFEVNLAAAERAKLTIRSSLLRLATRTIEHDQLENRDDDAN